MDESKLPAGSRLGRKWRKSHSRQGAYHFVKGRCQGRHGIVKKRAARLPLQTGAKVALFGKATFDYVKGGGGSGDVTVAYTRNLYEGIKALKGKISVYEELADFYRENVKEQYKAGRVPGMTIEPQVPQELLQKAKAYTDTAVISICRFSGEGWDRKSIVETENKNIWASEEEMARRSAEIFEDGDFF